MNCGRDWRANEDCAGCWATICAHLATVPTEKILPRAEFCQDAAFVAFVVDARLAQLIADIETIDMLRSESLRTNP